MTMHAAAQLIEAYNGKRISVPARKAREASVCTVCGCGGARPQIGGPAPRGKGSLESRTQAWQPRSDGTNSLMQHRSPPLSPAVEAGRRVVDLERAILGRNDAQAQKNRQMLAASRIRAINLMSSPGAGKTSWLVSTLEALPREPAAAVIEGDQQTELDAERIRATGAPAVQINTGKGCHLDAQMVAAGMARLDLGADSLLFIENVGNLVCPAAFDLGETAKVVLLSVTEGDDKPLKYPDMFAAADLMVVTKTDLLPYVDFDPRKAHSLARRVNPGVPMLLTSARGGEGMAEWLAWLAGLPLAPQARLEEQHGG